MDILEADLTDIQLCCRKKGKEKIKKGLNNCCGKKILILTLLFSRHCHFLRHHFGKKGYDWPLRRGTSAVSRVTTSLLQEHYHLCIDNLTPITYQAYLVQYSRNTLC